jgi:hypothetical protein
MASPIPTPKLLVSVKEPYCQLTLQIAHEARHSVLGRNGYYKMHVIRLHVQFQDFDRVFLLTQSIDLLLRVLADLILQNPISILRTEHNVILAFAAILNMGWRRKEIAETKLDRREEGGKPAGR